MFSIPSGVDGYGVNLGFETKALGGTVKASFGWGDFEGSHADNLTMKTYQTALGYNYPLSRRTTLYTPPAGSTTTSPTTMRPPSPPPSKTTTNGSAASRTSSDEEQPVLTDEGLS